MQKTKSLEQSYLKYEPMTLSASQERRLARAEHGMNRFAAIAAAGVLAVSGAVIAFDRLTEPKTHTVVETVQPYDNPSTVAQRAEKDFGSHPDRYNVQEEALRLAGKYGTLHAGEKLTVEVK